MPPDIEIAFLRSDCELVSLIMLRKMFYQKFAIVSLVTGGSLSFISSESSMSYLYLSSYRRIQCLCDLTYFRFIKERLMATEYLAGPSFFRSSEKITGIKRFDFIEVSLNLTKIGYFRSIVVIGKIVEDRTHTFKTWKHYIFKE